MSAISKFCILTLSLLWTQMSVAEAPPWAGLRIANALGEGLENLQVELDGRAWREEGLAAGEVSGLRRLPVGRHRLTFSVDGLGKREVSLTLKPDQVVTLLPHIGNPKRSLGPEIRVLKLERLKDHSGRLATVVDLGSKPRRLLEIKQLGKSWTPLALRRMELQRFSIVQQRGYLPLRVGRQRLPSLPVFEGGQHVVVLYEDRTGELMSLYYRDRTWPRNVAVRH